jgi:hypothetical protein
MGHSKEFSITAHPRDKLGKSKLTNSPSHSGVLGIHPIPFPDKRESIVPLGLAL